MKPTTRIAVIGLLTAVNVASRQFLQFLPNIKPITALIILCTVAFGLSFGIQLSVTTVLLSSVFLGFGAFVPFQILAWVIIAAFTYLLDKLLPFGRLLVFTGWAAACGYLYGIFVSLDMLFFVGPAAFWAYYLRGLGFDTLSAIGNLIFFPLCYKALLPILRRYAKENRFTKQTKA
jgi:energy-coupling factor transport system substrate-specific component